MAGTAPDGQAITLSEYGVLSNDPLVKKITYSLHTKGSVLKDIPMITKSTMIQNGVRFVGNLPSVNYRALNQVPTVTKGKPTPYQEQAFIVSNQFQIDKRLMNEDNAIQDPLQVQVESWLKSFTYDTNFKFIYNDEITGDANAPVGLNYRLNNTAQHQNNSEMKINGLGGSTVTATPSMTQANANDVIEAIEQIFDYMNEPDGDGVVLYVNDYLRRKLGRAARLLGPSAGFTDTKDNYDRILTSFRGATIRDIGRKADQTTRIISGTENSDGTAGSSTYTSIWGVRYGLDSFCGWQYEPLKPQNLGVDPTNGTSVNVVVDWAYGYWNPHTRAVARLYNIKIS